MAQIVPGTTTFLDAWEQVNLGARLSDGLAIVDGDDTQDEVVTRIVDALEAQRLAGSTSGLALIALITSIIDSMSAAQMDTVWAQFATMTQSTRETAMAGMLSGSWSEGQYLRAGAGGVPEGVAGSNYSIADDAAITAGTPRALIDAEGVTLHAAEIRTALNVAEGAGGINSVVEDLSPQLGGDLDGNAFDILFDDATGIRDDSDNEQLIFQKTATAVNHLEITNAATGNGPTLGAAGDDTDVALNIAAKGSGLVTFGSSIELGANTIEGADAADLLKLSELTATSTELNFVDGVTSAIQTQIDGKQASSAVLTDLTTAWVAASAAAASSLTGKEDTDNGAHTGKIQWPASLAANRTWSLLDADGNILLNAADTNLWAGSSQALGITPDALTDALDYKTITPDVSENCALDGAVGWNFQSTIDDDADLNSIANVVEGVDYVWIVTASGADRAVTATGAGATHNFGGGVTITSAKRATFIVRFDGTTEHIYYCGQQD